MGLKQQNVSVLAYANGFTMWHYKTKDIEGDVMNEGYFVDVYNILSCGDLIHINCGEGKFISCQVKSSARKRVELEKVSK